MHTNVKKEDRESILTDQEVRDLIKRSQDGDRTARDHLVERNVR